MSFFISDAYAQAGQGGGGGWEALLFPILLIVIFYFLLIRPQTKRAKEHRKLVEALAKGDEVVTSGGILGRVTDVGETFASVEIAEGIEVKLQKAAVSTLMPKGTYKQVDKDKKAAK
jgi:preprotein translocase subunit YajC